MSPDLSTRYLGLNLRSPIIASASPMTGDPASWEAIEAAGAGAIVLPSLFEEQIEHEERALDAALDFHHSSAESSSYFPDLGEFDVGPARHLSLVEQARNRLGIPVIASLNGTSSGGWVHYARSLENAGAQAIELNVFDIVVDPSLTAFDVEQRLMRLVRDVRSEVSVPLAVKIGPWYTALANTAVELQANGADGLVLFNRFYQPDIDLETLDVAPRLRLSSSPESRLPLHWIGILREHLTCSLAASSGVHTGEDAMKLLLVGADAVMTTSALLQHGPHRIAEMHDWIRAWMIEREYVSVHQLQGSVSRRNVPDPEVYERANYHQVLHSWRP